MNLIDAEDAPESEATDRQRQLRALELGVEIERFLSSPVGQYMVERSGQQQDDALDALASVDPEDPKEIRRLQSNFRLANQFGEWLRDGITEARNANERLKD